jgi:hypothetical protein
VALEEVIGYGFGVIGETGRGQASTGMTKLGAQKDTRMIRIYDVSFWPLLDDKRAGWFATKLEENAMDDARVRGLRLFLQIYGTASLILFAGLLLGFEVRTPFFDDGASGHWLIWDHVTDHVAPMLLAVYVVWSVFLIRAARDPLANPMFLDFTVWGNLAHGIVMVPHSLMAPEYHIKFLTDIPWVIIPVIAIPLLRRSAAPRTVSATTLATRRA